VCLGKLPVELVGAWQTDVLPLVLQQVEHRLQNSRHLENSQLAKPEHSFLVLLLVLEELGNVLSSNGLGGEILGVFVGVLIAAYLVVHIGLFFLYEASGLPVIGVHSFLLQLL